MTSTPKPTLSVADATAAEGDALTFTVTLTLSDVPNGDVRVTWTASVESGDTATEADLGSPTTGRVYIESSQTTGTFTVGTLKDATEERDETFTVTLSDPASNAQLATVATATGTIIDDLPADTTTTGQVVGSSVASNIGTGTDKDWFAVVLAADRRYQIDLEGADTGRGTLADPALELFDAAGTSLSASDDDGGVGRNARLIYTPSAAGAYHVQASKHSGSGGGTYTLSVIHLGANGVSKADTDFAADTSTSGRVEVGGSVTGTLTAANVVDWFAVDLEAGRRYRIDLEGADTNRGTLPDPVLWKILAPGDNLIYEKGTGRTGTYTLSVRDLAVIPAALPTLSIDDASGTEADGVQFTVTLSATTTAEVTVDWTASIGSGDTAVAADLGSTTTGTATVAASATTTTFTVATADDTDAETDETFTVTLSNPSANAELGTMSTATGTIADDNADTALAGIAVNGTGIPAFLATDFAPQHGVSATTTTAAMVATAASPSATVSYSGTDADISTMDVHDVMLSNGANTVAVADKGKSAAYHLGVNRAVTADYGWKADSDFDTLKRAVNNDPRGIWYDGATATFYVSDFRDDKVYAYNTDGTRDTGKDIPVSNYPNGIWSDGTTLWVADSGPDKLFAYTLSSRAANSGEDFDTLDVAGNDNPRGLWSHGSILWATDSDDDKLYAYNLPATMTPTNNAPVFANATETRTVPENSAAGTNVGAAIPEATDADSGDTLTYSMEGADAASFAFNASARQITTIANVDYNHEATKNSYSVTVKASDGTDSATVAVTINVADVNERSAKPAKPTLAAVEGSTTSLAASWTKPDLDGGPDITDYDVRYREGTSGGWTDVTHDGTDRTRTLAGLAADAAYQAQVRAYNGELESDWSDPSDAVRTNAEEATAPDAPRDVTATADGETRIDLDWRAPADDGGSAITGYRIEVSDDGGLSFEALATTGAAVTRYAHTGLSAGTTRHYQVYAVNAEGESPASSVVGATTEEEREPEGNEPSVIRTYWIGSGGSNDKSGCAGTEEFRAYWNPPLESNRTYKVADAWEADITLRGGAGDLDYTIQDTGGNPEHPELTGSVRIDGNGWLSMRVRGRFGADGWGGWSPTSSLYCRAASARVDGPLLALTWPTPRDGFAAPDGGDFAVHADGAAVAVTGATLVGRRALLTLGAPALPGQSVSVDYLGSAMHPLADADGVPVPAWTDLPAENLTGAPEDAQWAAVVALAEARRTAAGGLPALAAHGADPTSLSLAGAGLTDADLVALWWSGGPRPDRRDAPDAGPRRPETRPLDVFALAGLRRLDLSGNRLADVSLPADRRGLESLDLSGNALTDIAPLSTLTALRRLDLRGNRVADLAPLASLPRLEVLLLDGNRIADVGALTHLGTLEHLGLADNAVVDLAPLSDLWSLRRLDLGGNPATDLSPLGDLETLEWLRVPAANGVPAHRLIRLRWLWTGPVGICLGCGDGMR